MPPIPDHLDGLSPEDERWLEGIFRAFEDAWAEGRRPGIADYLPGDGPLRRPALVELVFIDQEYAVGGDPAATVESYLEQFPGLAAEPGLVAELVAREFRLRRRRGDFTPAEDYRARFPDLGDRLADLLQVETATASPHPSGSTLEADASSDPDEPPRVLPSEEEPRYQSIVFHARGGLGFIYRARDVALDRDVALKRIRPKFERRSIVRRRFLREVRLTARLTHPGVVPIHDLTRDREGRPWYVMRFVEGQTLAQAIGDFHAARPGRARVEFRSLEFRQLLARFVAACDTIDFAHSKQVVHRDLKPSNVMLGRFGETIVLDWGLATTIADGPGDQPGPSGAAPPAEEVEPLTRDGQVIGTPAYMAPEQAKGLPSMNLPGVDVYSLGAILYELLTGRTPFGAGSWETLRQEITQGRFPHPRRVKPGVPKALDAICLKAMTTEPGGRYRTAGELTRDLERWAADEPVDAWPEPLGRRAVRWSKRHRTPLATVAASSIVAAALLGWASWTRIVDGRRADASARSAVARADALAIDDGTPGDPSRWERAIAEALQARERLASAGSPDVRDEVETRLERFRAGQARALADLRARSRDRRVVDALDEARVRKTNTKGLDYDVAAKTDAYLAAFRAYGIDVAALAIEDAASRVRSSPVADDLIAALDDWAAEHPANVPEARLAAIASAADSDPTGAAVRDAILRRDGDRLRRLCKDEADRRKLGPRFRSVFDALSRLDPGASLPLLEAIRRENPSDFWLNHDLGLVHAQAKPPRFQEAMRCLSVAVALRPTSAGVHVSVGNTLKHQGDLEVAIAEFRTAVRHDPGYALAHNNLGVVLNDHGDVEEAIREYQAALQLEPDFSTAHNNMGYALLAKKDVAGAIVEFRAAIRLDSNATEPHNNLGVALESLKKFGEAAVEFRAAIERKPDNAMAHANLGHALHLGGDVDGAMAAYRAALDLDPNLSEPRNNLGFALKGKGDFDGAIEQYRHAIRVKPRYYEAYNNLGFALKAKGKLDEAIAAYRTGLEIEPRFGRLRNNLGQALVAKGDLDGGIAEFRAAIRDNPDFADPYNNLGLALRIKGDLDGAVEAFRKTIELDPGFAEAHCMLGKTEEARGDLTGALAHLEKGHQIGSKRANWPAAPAQWVADCRQLIAMDARLPAILAGNDPPRDGERLTLADLCFKKKRYVSSTRFFGEAFAADPAPADDPRKAYRFNAACAAVLAGLGRGIDDPSADEASRPKLREKALGWLRAERTGWAKLVESGGDPDRKEANQALAGWKINPDLAGIRDEAALANLPNPEREAFRAFWAEVETLRKKAGGT